MITITITGPSGCGKTTTAKLISEAITKRYPNSRVGHANNQLCTYGDDIMGAIADLSGEHDVLILDVTK